jgi:hypothetical protein
MKIVMLFCLFVVFSCGGENQGVSTDGVISPSNEDFEVRFLFEKDGLQIYRFKDAGEYRYFSMGNGNFLPQIQERTTSNGKTRHVEKWSDGVE